MNSAETKRSFKALTREMKEVTRLADARQRAIDQSIKQLQTQGVSGVPRVLKTHGEHFSPAERELLENATDEQLTTLVETHKMLKKLKAQMLCI